jgi:hypothetical protein
LGLGGCLRRCRLEGAGSISTMVTLKGRPSKRTTREVMR